VSTTTQVAAPPALAVAAEAAAAQLPSLGGWTFEPADPGEGAGSLQPTAATAVVADVGELGRLVLLAASALARAVQVGPPPAEDVVDGLSPALLAAATAFGVGAADVAQQGADMALLTEGDEVVHAIRLIDGAEHMATVVLIAPDSSTTVQAPPPADLAPLTAAPRTGADGHPLEVLSDVELSVTVELGRTRMLLRDVLDLVPGSVIELDRAAGAPVDLLVNGTLIARGEVVVVDEEYGVRITEVVGHDATRGKRP
jgi:flagellar motor switch protein FliN/FliY